MKLVITAQFEEFLRNIGVHMEDVLKRAKVPNRLWQEEVTLTTVEYYNMLMELDKELPESVIRTLSDIENMKMFMPALFAALSSENGIEAVKRFSKFKKLVGPIEVDYLISDQTLSISYSYVHRQQQLPKFSVLNEQLLILSLLRQGTGERLIPLLVETPFEYGDDTVDEIGVIPQKSGYNQIVFSMEDMKKPFLTYNNIMYSYLEPELNRRLALMEKENSFANFVQKELISAIPGGYFSIEDIAAKLGVSGRTLQRNLAAENTGYKEQLQAVQKSMAFSYLNMKLSTDEIASLVGYTETNAFLKAFKKWTGMSLTEYKKRNMGEKD